MRKRNHNQLYVKLFRTYTIVLLCVVIALILYFYRVSTMRMLESNMEKMEQVNSACADYIEETQGITSFIYQDLYRSHSVLEDLYAYLEMEPEAYQEYSLDRYAAVDSLVYDGMVNFLTESFEAYSTLEKVEVISYRDDRMTIYYPDKTSYPDQDGRARQQELARNNYEQDGKLIYTREIRRTDNMENIGCIIFTFEGEAHFAQYQKESPITQTVILSRYTEPVYQKILTEDWRDLQGDAYYQTTKLVDPYTVYSFQEKSAAKQISLGSSMGILFTGILLGVLGMLFIEYYVRRLSERVAEILGAMNQVTTGNLHVRLETGKSRDELDMIAGDFNDMCEKLELYIRKSYLAEIEQKNAQLQALQSQINPHFLYNTLEAIRMKAICNGDREVGKMLYSMVSVFRSQIKEADVITLGQELDYCKQYMELFVFRYQGIFQVSVECEPELLQLPIIKFVLQPLVENYFIHGIDRERKDNRVDIRAERKEQQLILYIEDNGRGMEPEAMAEKNRELRENLSIQKKGQSIGITNVNRRIKAVYGDDCGVFLETAESGGLRIIVKIKIDQSDCKIPSSETISTDFAS